MFCKILPENESKSLNLQEMIDNFPQERKVISFVLKFIQYPESIFDSITILPSAPYPIFAAPAWE